MILLGIGVVDMGRIWEGFSSGIDGMVGCWEYICLMDGAVW